MRSNWSPRRARAPLLLCLFACAASPYARRLNAGAGQAKTPRTSTDGMRISDAEKSYVAPQATTRVAHQVDGGVPAGAVREEGRRRCATNVKDPDGRIVD